MTDKMIRIQICFARPDLQILHDMQVSEGTTVQEAILQSGLLKQNKEIDLTVSKVGIYGKLKSLDTIVREHDRVEIYRPLVADPMESRRHRAIKKAIKKPTGQ